MVNFFCMTHLPYTCNIRVDTGVSIEKNIEKNDLNEEHVNFQIVVVMVVCSYLCLVNAKGKRRMVSRRPGSVVFVIADAA
jgi:hypothetical protein